MFFLASLSFAYQFAHELIKLAKGLIGQILRQLKEIRDQERIPPILSNRGVVRSTPMLLCSYQTLKQHINETASDGKGGPLTQYLAGKRGVPMSLMDP